MKPLEIGIYHETKESMQLCELGVKSSIYDCQIVFHTFYTIDHISSMEEDGIEYGVIYSCGDSYVTPVLYEDLKRLLSCDN